MDSQPSTKVRGKSKFIWDIFGLKGAGVYNQGLWDRVLSNLPNIPYIYSTRNDFLHLGALSLEQQIYFAPITWVHPILS